MTVTVLAVLDDGQHDLADRIEAALHRNGRLSPAEAARHARCTTAEARHVLAWLAGQQYADVDNAGNYLPHR